ncbi:hypothetical protein G6F22_018406 [Rhizopus arrhizus]|nr:hypothetical protein G6F22_018406 [Rhizopus arrhizus]
MHRLAPKVEPLQAAMQHHGAVGDQRVRQGVLAQRTRVVHVHQQAEEERGEEPHSARLVHAPEGDDQQQHVGCALPQAPRQQRNQPHQQHRSPDENAVGRTGQASDPPESTS